MHRRAASRPSTDFAPLDQVLWSLGYAATSATPPGHRQLQQLFDAVGAAYAEAGLTSIALSCGGDVLQVIEGPYDQVHLAYTGIVGRRRLEQPLELFEEPVRLRDYPGTGFSHASVQPVQFAALLALPELHRRRSIAAFWHALQATGAHALRPGPIGPD